MNAHNLARTWQRRGNQWANGTFVCCAAMIVCAAATFGVEGPAEPVFGFAAIALVVPMAVCMTVAQCCYRRAWRIWDGQNGGAR